VLALPDFEVSLLATVEDLELSELLLEADGDEEVEDDVSLFAATEPEALPDVLPLSEPDVPLEDELGEVLLVLD
jgi:hypothetical protein